MKGPIKRTGSFTVYMVECKNGTFYTGYTSNINNRIRAHNRGTGSKYLKGKGPVKLVYSQEFRYYKCAVKKERHIKTFSRRKKEAMVEKYSINN